MKSTSKKVERFKSSIPGNKLTEKDKREITAAVKKAVKEYGETFRLLAKS